MCICELFPFSNIESASDFHAAVIGTNDDCLIDLQLLNEVKLEMKCDFMTSTLTADDDLDADVNYYNALFNNVVKYYETSGLNSITPVALNETPQFIMHVNARSLTKNIGPVVTELSLLSNRPSILAVTETWALTDNDNLPIPGYSSISKARKDKTGGGVAIYLQNKINLKYKVRVDLSLGDCAESLFIQLTNSKQKHVIIGVVYKPPDTDVEKFNNTMEDILKAISTEHKPCYLMGDFNINY